MGFSHTVTCRFHHIDQAGIIFFGQYFTWCHDAFEELLGATVGPEVAACRAPFGLPLVHADGDFVSLTRIGDRLRIEVHVERLGEGSITFRYELVGADDERPRATVRTVHAFVRMPEMRPLGHPPAALVEALQVIGLLQAPPDRG